jgi:hypothetical protein
MRRLNQETEISSSTEDFGVGVTLLQSRRALAEREKPEELVGEKAKGTVIRKEGGDMRQEHDGRSAARSTI